MTDSSLIFSIIAMDHASGVLGKIGGSWNKLSLAIGAASGAMVLKTVDMAANFQTSMTKLVTSAGETQANLAGDSAGVLSMMGSLGDTADQLTSALYTINSGGQHGADGLLVLKAAAQGAKSEGADLAVVGDAVTSVLQDYHLKATDAANVTSKLIGATAAGKTTFEQLAGSLSSVLPVASAAHISLNDVLAAISSMTVHGMSADQVTQNLADTIRHLQNPTIAMQKELSQLGINAADLSGMLSTKGLTGTLSYVSDTILQHMGPSGKVLLGTFRQSQQAASDLQTMLKSMPANLQDLANRFAAGTISGKDWHKALMALSPDQANLLNQFATLQKSSTGFADALKSGSPAAQTYSAALAKAMGDSTGLNTALMLTGENTKYVQGALAQITGSTADAAGNVKGWAEIQGTFNQKLSEFKGGVSAAGIEIGNMFLPALTKVMGVAAGAAGWLQKHTTILKVLAGSLVVVTAALTGYKLGMMAAEAMTKATEAAQLAWKGIQVGIAGATKVWAAAQWLLNVAMDANPVGLIVVAIGAVIAGIVLLWTHSKAFRDFFIGMWKDFLTGLDMIGHWFAGPFADFFVKGWHDVTDLWDKGEKFIKAMPDRIKAAFVRLGDILIAPYKWAFNEVSDLWNGTVGKLKFSFPSWVPGLGGKTLQMPTLPHMASGGIVRARPGGTPVLLGEGGRDEAVVPLGHGGGGGGHASFEFHAAPADQVAEMLLAILRPTIKSRYRGDVTLALSGNRR